MIPFNRPANTGNEAKYISEAISSNHLSGDGPFTKKCHQWFEEHLKCEKALLTPSCTAALEMAAILIDIKSGDEVIMPSYTFVSTANAFVLRGAKIVFVDIRPDTMNIDESLIEAAISPKTKAIVPVHYAGVSCEMDVIMALANKYNLYVIEDAAQAMMSTYKGKALGTIGHIGTYSFHATKNYTSGGEGGLLIINDKIFAARSEIIRDKGTNRSEYFRGTIDKYSWVDIGSSYLLSDIQSAYLFAQLQFADEINKSRLKAWFYYQELFLSVEHNEYFSIPETPFDCIHNAHMFYIILSPRLSRRSIINSLALRDITCASHFEPLHSAKIATLFSKMSGEDLNTSNFASRIMRLPIYYDISETEIQYIYSSLMDVIHNEK